MNNNMSKAKKLAMLLAGLLWGLAAVGFLLNWRHKAGLDHNKSAITKPSAPHAAAIDDLYVKRYGEVWRATCQSDDDCLPLRPSYSEIPGGRYYCSFDGLYAFFFTGKCHLPPGGWCVKPGECHQPAGRCIKEGYPCQYGTKCESEKGCRLSPR